MKAKEKTWCVYCHTNKINGKKYIGITSKIPHKRWGKNGAGYKTQMFYRAIRKYGWDNFEHEIIQSGLTIYDANRMEKELIVKYNTRDEKYGYNVESGGQNPLNRCGKTVYQYSLSGEYLAKYESCAEAQRLINPNAIGGVSGCAGGYSRTHAGFIWSYDKLDNIPSAYLGTPIHQYSLNGVYIQTFHNISSAADACDGSTSNICKAASGELGYAFGYQWRYDKYNILEPIQDKSSRISTILSQHKYVFYDVDGNMSGIYDSSCLASKEHKVNKHTLSMSKCNILMGSGDNRWIKYLSDEHNIAQSVVPYVQNIVCQYTLDGEYVCSYDTIVEAARNTNARPECVRLCLVGESLRAGEYMFRNYKKDKIPPYISRQSICAQLLSKSVHQYSMDGEYERSYLSISDAGRTFKVDRNAITNAAIGKSKSSAGHRWSFDKMPQLDEKCGDSA